jgi:hypothetical protein
MSDQHHDIYAPSSSSTWLECTYSARHSVPEPPKPLKTKLAADEGTRVHTLFEVAISEMEMPEEGDTAADAIALGLDFVRQLEPGTIHTELKLRLTEECGGTTDLWNEAPRIVTWLDLKNGKWDVDAHHNTQMLSYGAMALPMTDAEWWRFVIFQPNGLDEKPFKQWIAHRSQVEAHRDRMLRAIADRSPPRPGPWCRWCKAFQQCPAMSTDAGFVMGAMTRRIEDLTTEDLVRLLRLIRALGDMKPVYDDALTTHLKMGRQAEGATLKPVRSWRAFNDPQHAAEFGYQTYGAKGVRPLTPAQLEKQGLAGKQYVAVAAHKPTGELKAAY